MAFPHKMTCNFDIHFPDMKNVITFMNMRSYYIYYSPSEWLGTDVATGYLSYPTIHTILFKNNIGILHSIISKGKR